MARLVLPASGGVDSAGCAGDRPLAKDATSSKDKGADPSVHAGALLTPLQEPIDWQSCIVCMDDLRNHWYMCLDCPDFDLCRTCFKDRHEPWVVEAAFGFSHTLDHAFKRMGSKHVSGRCKPRYVSPDDRKRDGVRSIEHNKRRNRQRRRQRHNNNSAGSS